MSDDFVDGGDPEQTDAPPVDVPADTPPPDDPAADSGENFYAEHAAVELSPELLLERKKMRASFIKKKEGQNQVRKDYEQLKAQVTSLQTDDQAAANYIQNRFPGYQLTPITQAGTPVASEDQSTLGAGLEFLDGPISKKIKQEIEAVIAPVRHQQHQQSADAQLTKLQALSTQLADRAPTWEDEQAKMVRYQQFVKSGQLESPEFGSLLDILYDGVTKNRQVASGYAQHMSTVARSQTATSKAPRGHSNLSDMIMKAPKTEAFRLASEQAERDLATRSK